MKLFNLTAAAVAIGVADAQDGFTERELELNQRSIDMGEGRAAKFKESDGYVVIEKSENCWEACGSKRGWSGFCSFCSLSNGSPGFCCNPRSNGGCSAGMVKAVRNSELRSKNHYQCIVPKTMDDNVMTHYTMLDRPNCWSNCGRKRGWAGRCSYCGPNGYCCHADGRGGCTTEMADVLRVNRKRGMRCIVPDTIKNDLRTETKLSSACKDVHKTECRTLADYKGKAMDFESLIDCTRFFSAKTCVSVDKMTINDNAKPICTTKITNFCASEGSQRATRMIDGTSDIDFAASGQYETWPVHAKEFYEFMRPQWIGADGTSDKAACEADATIVFNADAGTDHLTVPVSGVTGNLAICDNDRADVVALKAIIDSVATANPTIFGKPDDDSKTGSQRAAEMMETFITALDNWDGNTDTAALESGQITEIATALGGGDVPTATAAMKNTAVADPAFELFSLVIGAMDDFTGSTTNTEMVQSAVDPEVSYDQTSLMNMPKSAFDDMINDLPTIAGTTPISTVKANYQSLINDAGNASPVDQVFWNFLTDTESPVSLNSNQLDAISQAMTSIDPADSASGDAFCGHLTSLNQVLRSTVTDAEADAIMRELQKHTVAYKNVATLMEVMNFLEDGAALVAAGAEYVAPKTVPTPQDVISATYSNWVKADLYNVASIDNGVSATGFDALLSDAIYYNIIVAAVEATPDAAIYQNAATDQGSFRANLVTALMTTDAILTTAQTDAEACVDNANGAPQIYKNIMYDYLTKVESVDNTNLPQDTETWAARAAESECDESADEAAFAALDADKKLSCRLATCVESMGHVTFANPAGEVCDDIQGCIMLAGGTAERESFAAMCEKPDFKHGLNQVLTAVAVLDANPDNGLDDINTLFKCSDPHNPAASTCVFGDGTTTNIYQQGVPTNDDTTCSSGNRRTLTQAIREQEDRKRGIITGGFIVPGLKNMKASGTQKFQTQTVSWWDTTMAWTTTDFFNKPNSNKKPNKGNSRGIETITEAPSLDSFNDVMIMAVADHSTITWTEGTDEATAAFCTVNPCLACQTNVQSKIVSTSLPNGQTSSECVCPANVADSDNDGTVDDLSAVTPVELAQPIYAQVVLDYFSNWQIAPAADATSDPEMFRPDELQCIAAALADLPAPTGASNGMPMTSTQYMTHTRGIVINHLMNKIYAKGDLDLETRIQGALDEDMFRHNMYFVLETLFQVEQEIRATTVAPADPDFTPLNNFHVESSGMTPVTPSATATLDWTSPTMAGNDASVLSEDYMTQILAGLNGGNDASQDPLITSVKEHYTEIFERTSELTDCAFSDKVLAINWVCDARVPEPVWSACGSDNQCFINAMAQSTDGTGVCTTDADAMADNTDPAITSNCACDRFEVEQCKAGAAMQTDNSNWKWQNQNPLYGAWGEQWMMDMASHYSSIGDPATTLTQAEMCSLEQAISEAMAAGAAGADGGASDFGANMYNDVASYIANNGGYSKDFSDKVSAIFAAAEGEDRDEALDWLIATAEDMSGEYANNWKGNAVNGEGHGSAQYGELYNLMDGMQNGGGWDALGGATLGGSAFDSSAITELNDGAGGNWGTFDQTAYDEWITTSLDESVMGTDYAAANTGSNSKYGENYDNIFGWRSTAAPFTGPTQPQQTLATQVVGVGVALPIAPEDLDHTSCLMDEQVALIEQFMAANSIGTADATAIKDAAIAYLQATANNDDGNNPTGINTFTGGVANINLMMDAVLASMTPVNANAVALTDQPGYATLLAQLDLMAKVGDPSNKENLDKDAFKAVDWDSIIAPGTTADTFDPTTVMANLETAIGTSAIPATVTEVELGKTGDALTAATTNNVTADPNASTAATTADPNASTAATTADPNASTAATTAATTADPNASTAATTAAVTTAAVTTAAVTTAAATTAAVTTATTQNGNGLTNANGNTNNPGNTDSNANGNNNGYGSMYGDPHIMIKNPDEPAICFDIHGMHMEVMNVLSDFNTGLTVNSRLVREGKHIRMAEVYLVTPKGDKLSVTEEGVTIVNIDFNNTYTFDKAIDVQRPEVLVVSRPDHKNDNIHIYIIGNEDAGVTEFLIVRKRLSKHSMKFSIVSNQGLSHNLGGVVGQNLIPQDYHIDDTGNIMLKDRVISSSLVEYSVEDDCYKINDIAAAKFLGHSTRDFILESSFEKFNPSWVQAQLREDVSPK